MESVFLHEVSIHHTIIYLTLEKLLSLKTKQFLTSCFKVIVPGQFYVAVSDKLYWGDFFSVVVLSDCF